MRTLYFPLAMMVFAMTQANAQNAPQTPPPGSQERAVLLDTARAPVQKELGKPVQFVVKRLSVLDGWAYLYATMQSPGGQPVSYVGTPFAQAAEHGAKSDDYLALLRLEDGKWQVRADAIGPTDVAWAAWPEQYGAPQALFGPIPDVNP